MSPDKIITITAGLFATIFTYWFFLGKKDLVIAAGKSIDIKVEGGYSPAAISIPRGRPTQINFTRTDPSSCLEEVVLSDFKVRKYLPLNKKISITINPDQAGTHNFTCGMHMFHGKLIVE